MESSKVNKQNSPDEVKERYNGSIFHCESGPTLCILNVLIHFILITTLVGGSIKTEALSREVKITQLLGTGDEIHI